MSNFIRIKRKRNEEPLDALLIDAGDSNDHADNDSKRAQYRKKRQKQGLFRLAETVEEATFSSTDSKEELHARLKRKAEDDLSEDVSSERRRLNDGDATTPRRIASRPQKRYHVVTGGEESGSKDVFIDVREDSSAKHAKPASSASSSQPFDPYDEDSEQMREFRRLVEDYLKMQDVVTLKDDQDKNKEADQPKDTDDYVFDVYYRDAHHSRHSPQVMSNIGLLTGLSDQFGVDLDDYSSDSTDIQDEADEDSNEEDYYTNDYPDEEVGSGEEEYAEDFVDDDSD